MKGPPIDPAGFKCRSTLCRVSELSQMRRLRPEASPKAVLKVVRTFRAKWKKEARDHNFSDKSRGARLLINGKRRSIRIALLASTICSNEPMRVSSTHKLPRIGFELIKYGNPLDGLKKTGCTILVQMTTKKMRKVVGGRKEGGDPINRCIVHGRLQVCWWCWELHWWGQ